MGLARLHLRWLAPLVLASALASCAPPAAPPPGAGVASPAAAPRTPITPPDSRDGAEVAVAQPPAQTAGAPVRVFRIVPAQSEASYEVQEKFARLPLPSKAVGRTSAISGEFRLRLDGTPRLEDNQFTVDLRTLTSDSARRDGLIREQWLESNRYPMAEFRATRIDQLPAGVVEGQEVTVKITGAMTIREVTRELTFDARATWQGNTISGTATTFLLMRDFGFDPPEILGIVTVEDGVTLSVKFTAQAEPGAAV